MKPGPKPKPTRVKELQGNAGRRPLPANEPQLPAKVLRKPRGTKTKDPYVSQFYAWFARALGEAGITTELDSIALYATANAWKRFKQAEAIIDQEGTMTTDENGLPRKHPMLQVERDSRKALFDGLARFGMSPSDRSRIVAIGLPEEPSIFDILTGGHAGGD
jgi:P27 family predicted phage terminase small subunit